MVRLFRLLVVGMLLGVAALAQAGGETPRQFVERIYANYRDDGQPISLNDDKSIAILTPSLFALVQQDKAALDGEAGVLDPDPLCVCQDYDLKLEDVQIREKDAAQVEAIASFSNLGERHKVRLDLRKADGKWRIDDIWEDEVSTSLRAKLEAEIASLKPRP